MAVESLEERVDRVVKLAQKAADIQEVKKVMALHAFWDAQGKNRYQLHEIWAMDMPDVTWANNVGFWVGPDNLEKYYADIWDKNREDRLKKITQIYPEIENIPENDLVGWMKMHTNCSHIIEIAGDGQTAKMMTESPGFVTELLEDSVMCIWMNGRGVADFIKRDGQWKMWHFNGMFQYMAPFKKSWVDRYKNIGHFKKPNADLENALMAKENNRHVMFSPYKLCGACSPNFPKPPEPYYTFSETFTYGME